MITTFIAFAGFHIFFLLFLFLSTTSPTLPPAPAHTLPLHTTLTLHTLHDGRMDGEDELHNVRDGEMSHGQLVETTRGTLVRSEEGHTTLNLIEGGMHNTMHTHTYTKFGHVAFLSLSLSLSLSPSSLSLSHTHTCWLAETFSGWNESTNRATILFTTWTVSTSIRAGYESACVCV